MRFLITVLLAAVMACASTPRSRVEDPSRCKASCTARTSYWVDSEFEVAERDAIDEGFAVWNRGTGGRECFDASINGDADLYVWRVAAGSMKGGADGYYTPPNSIRLSMKLAAVDLSRVTAHEFGHYLRIYNVGDEIHSPSVTSIMHPTMGKLDKGELPVEDRKAYCGKRGCACQ